MVDNLSKDDRRKAMSAVKSKETSLEIRVAKHLWRCGVRYRKNVKDLYGKPDIAIKNKKFVLFIDSCYWHGCPTHCRLPVSNQEYWKKKIVRNIARDEQVTEHYLAKGWKIIRVWEHDLKRDFEATMNNILAELRSHVVK